MLRLYPALERPAFRLFWTGMLPSSLAWQVGMVASPYAAYTIDGTATSLGLVSFAGGLPILLFSLVGGVAADRLPRRTVILVAQMGLAGSALILAMLAASHALQVWQIAAISFVQGTTVAFQMPARQALIAELVGSRLLRNAVALNNSGLNLSRVMGPAIAGMLLVVPGVGVPGVFWAMVVLYIVVLATLTRLPSSDAAERDPGRTGRLSPGRELVEGLSYVAGSPVLRALLLVGFGFGIIGLPFQSLIPVFADRVLNVGPGGLGALMAALGIGALSGSLVVAALANAARPARIQLIAAVSFGIALVGFALTSSFIVALAALAAVGFLSAAFMAINNTLVMSNTEPRFHGRVMSIYLLSWAGVPLGAMPLAWLAESLGASTSVSLAGALVAALMLGVGVFYKPFRAVA